ncbi:MAG: ATP-binding protein [Sulfurifustis sp.]
MTQSSILEQWRRFVEGLSPSNQISDVILASWQRSREAGVPTAREALVFRRVDEDELERRRFVARELLATANRHLDWLDIQLSDMLHLVSIVDRDGIVLVSRGPHRLLESFRILPGFDWSEGAMGTNGAGTALAISAPVAVAGPEHFSTAWHECACAAAPVHAPDGSVIGVVDLSTSVSNAHPNHLALVSYIASTIDTELQLRAALDERKRLLEPEQSPPSTPPIAEAPRERDERFAIADDAPTVLWVTDADGAIQFVNRAYREFFGTTLDAIKQSGWQRLVHPDDSSRYIDTFFKALKERQPFRAQARIKRADGQWRWIESYGQPRYSASGEFLGMAASSPDITDQKNAEEALREADRRKDEFLAVLSHELRNPLAPIRSSFDVLERATPGSEQAQRAQAVIGRQITHLTRLVDDLLDVTRIGRGKIQLQRERLELTELVRRTAEDHRIAFLANEVSLSVAVADMPLWINADPTRIAQVIGNLLQNAAKFTQPGGEVEVSLEASDGCAVLCVRDTGLGIPPDMLGTIFEPFAQADTTLARSRGGLGIGLALVRGLAELHGGTVSATSDGEGRGSVFAVRLPLESAPAVRVAPGASTTEAICRRVLVVEDNVDAANGLRELLEMDGHEVAVAYSGHEGLQKAREMRPDIVLCDIGLPEMDGYAVARAFRDDKALDGIFLVALTGYALPSDLRKAVEAGFDLHLAKPPNLEALQNVLRHATPRIDKGDVAAGTGSSTTDARKHLRAG